MLCKLLRIVYIQSYKWIKRFINLEFKITATNLKDELRDYLELRDIEQTGNQWSFNVLGVINVEFQVLSYQSYLTWFK